MNRYAYQGSTAGVAKALGKALPVSTKQCVEICKAIKGKPLSKAVALLEAAANLERAIPFTRFTEGAGHKPGIGPGKYPVKAARQVLQVLKAVEANAQNQGLSSDLVVIHAAAHQASRSYKYGRHVRRKEKSTHLEVVVKEAEGARRVAKEKKQAQPKTRPKAAKQAASEKKAKVEKASTGEKPGASTQKSKKTAVTRKEGAENPKASKEEPKARNLTKGEASEGEGK